jgi:hypothetical protein
MLAKRQGRATEIDMFGVIANDRQCFGGATNLKATNERER